MAGVSIAERSFQTLETAWTFRAFDREYVQDDDDDDAIILIWSAETCFRLPRVWLRPSCSVTMVVGGPRYPYYVTARDVWRPAIMILYYNNNSIVIYYIADYDQYAATTTAAVSVIIIQQPTVDRFSGRKGREPPPTARRYPIWCYIPKT